MRGETGETTVDVWRLSLGDDAPDYSLSPDETGRAEALIDPREKERFVRRQRLLRDVLARYVDIVPGALEFTHTPTGKPLLVQHGSTDAIAFNASDTADAFIIAVSHGVEIGIDVERRRALDDAKALAQRFFSAAEADALATLPTVERDDAVLTCWVRKEAVMKAHGGGMALGLDCVDVGFASIGPGPLIVDAGGRRFAVRDFNAGNGLISALAAKAEDFRVAYRTRD